MRRPGRTAAAKQAEAVAVAREKSPIDAKLTTSAALRTSHTTESVARKAPLSPKVRRST